MCLDEGGMHIICVCVCVHTCAQARVNINDRGAMH